MDTKTILLIRREGVSTCAPRLLIIDDLFPGLLTGEFYVISVPDGKVFPISALVKLYDFPEEMGHPVPRLLNFLKGAKPALFEEVSFYEDLTFDIKKECD